MLWPVIYGIVPLNISDVDKFFSLKEHFPDITYIFNFSQYRILHSSYIAMQIYIARHSVAHAPNPSIQEAETGGSQTSYQPKLHTNYGTKNKNKTL